MSRVVVMTVVTTLLATHSYVPWSSFTRFTIVRLPSLRNTRVSGGNVPSAWKEKKIQVWTPVHILVITINTKRPEKDDHDFVGNSLNAILSKNFCFKFHWNLFLIFKETLNQHWYSLWIGMEHVTSSPKTKDHPVQQCISRSQWVKLLAWVWLQFEVREHGKVKLYTTEKEMLIFSSLASLEVFIHSLITWMLFT